MASDKIVIEFDGDIRDLKAKLSSSDKQVSRLNKSAAKLKTSLAGAGKLAAVGFGALTAALAGAVNEAAKFETITTQFETLTGSAEQATKTVKELQDFTAKTPFQFESVSTAARQLLSFGVSVDNVGEKLQAIGDVSSASGKDISELSVIFGQIRAQGKLTGERLNQLVEAAVPIGPALAKTMGVAEKSIRSLVSKGEVDFATFEKAFISLSQKGGFAFEGMIKQSKTLSGLISTVKDNVSLFAADIGKQLLPVAKLLAERFLTLIQNLRDGGEGFETLTTAMSGTLKFAALVKASFENLGAVIGVGLATALEASIAAINLNFKQAAKIVEGGAKEVGEVLKENDKKLKKDLLDIDEAFRTTKRNRNLADKEKAKEDAAAETEIKAQAMIEEDELLREVEMELAERKFADEEARLEAINVLTKSKLKEKFDAKRAVEQDDIKSSIKENQLRMKDEIKYGKNLAASKAFFRSQDATAYGMMLDNLVTLGRSGNKELVRVAQAASVAKAIMNTAEGVTKALAIGGPILGPILAGTMYAAGAVQIATIKSQGFAKGGLVEGGTLGRDSVPAMMQQGEIVAPRSNFEEVIGSVRAKREADKLNEEGTSGGAMEVVVGFADNAFEIIEEKILERRTLGIGAI